MPTLFRRYWLHFLFLIPALVTIAFALGTPSKGSVLFLGLLPRQVWYLRLTAGGFALVTWQAAAHAILTLLRLTRSCSDPDKRIGFRRVADGLAFITGGVMATYLLGQLIFLLQWSDPASFALVILANYTWVLSMTQGFWLIFWGTERLCNREPDGRTRRLMGLIGALFAVFSVAYVVLVFTNPVRTISPSSMIVATFGLSDAVIALTLVVPFLAGLGFALAAMFRIARYHIHLGGVPRFAADSVIFGTILFVLGTVYMQVFIALGATRIHALGPIFSFVLTETGLFAQTVGFFYLARGFRRIEEVEHAHLHGRFRDGDPVCLP